MTSGNTDSMSYSAMLSREDYTSGNVSKTDPRMIKEGPIMNCAGIISGNKRQSIQDRDFNMNIKNIKKLNVLNEFKATLAETEKFTSKLHFNKNKSLYEQLNEVNKNKGYDFDNGGYDNNANNGEPSTISISQTQNQKIEEDDPCIRLKISNDILIKTNLDLRNINKILHDEIDAYKNSSSYQSPYSQYDLNLNEFISNIKQALNTSQISNQELQEIVQQSHKRTEELSKANSDIVHHYDTMKSDFENTTRQTCELKTAIGNRDNKINQLNQTITFLQENISKLQENIIDNEKQIDYQKTINSSYTKYKEDSNDMLNSFKQTIENLQKGNMGYIEKINELQNEVDQLKTKIISNEIINEKNENELKIKENNIFNQNNQINEFSRSINELKEALADKSNDIRLLNGDKDKLNSQIESLNLFIEDRETTITTLKTSLSILTKTFENDMMILKGNPNESVPVQLQLNERIDQLIDTIKKKDEIIEEMTVENNALVKGRNDCQKEIDEYINQFEQSQYEYQLLFQKYKEQTGLIDTLKVEFLNKRNDKELMELIKANEDIMKKLKIIQEENKTKTQELNDLKKNYMKISKELYQVQCLNTSLEMANTQYLLSSQEQGQIQDHKKGHNQSGKKSIRKEQKLSPRQQHAQLDFSLQKQSQPQAQSQPQYYQIPSSHSQINSQQFLCEINDLEESSSTSLIEPSLLPQYNNNSNNNIAFNSSTKSTCFHYIILDSSSIISFNLQLNTFKQISYQDITGNSYSTGKFRKTYDKSSSISINFPNGLFIINGHLVFYFNPLTNTIEQIAKLHVSHKKSSAIYHNNELYVISGEKTHVCEKINFSIDLNNQTILVSSEEKLPDINFFRTDSGLCLINNKYLIAVLGHCERQGSIERLDLSQRKASWQVIEFSLGKCLGVNSLNLSHFLCFVNEEMIIITGGLNNEGVCNSTLYHLDMNLRTIDTIGDSQCYSLFNEPCIQLEQDFYMSNDIDGNIHVFNKGFDYYKVSKLNYSNEN